MRRIRARISPDAREASVTKNAMASHGRPLSGATRPVLESRFGHDFSRVTIHTDDAAARATEQAHAKAMAIGSHVLFADSKYRPNTPDGVDLLHHELAHVVQYDRSDLAFRLTSASLLSDRGDASEREASQAAESLGSGAANVSVGAALASPVSCDGDDDWQPPMAPEPSSNPGPQSSSSAPTSYPGDVPAPAPASAPAPTPAPTPAPAPAATPAPPPAATSAPAPADPASSSTNAPTSYPGDVDAPVPGATGPTPSQCQNWNAGLPDEWRQQCPAPPEPQEAPAPPPTPINLNGPWFSDSPAQPQTPTAPAPSNSSPPAQQAPTPDPGWNPATPSNQPVPGVFPTPLTIPPDQSPTAGPLSDEQYESDKAAQEYQEQREEWFKELSQEHPEQEYDTEGAP